MRASAVSGIVFANVNDNLLEKLTKQRSMASVPFGASFRMIDFSLSNLVNAGVSSVGIITKENYRSLMDHVGSGVYWDLDRKNGGVYLLPPYSTSGARRYIGTVDALNGATDFIKRSQSDYVVLCNADTIANVDLSAAIKTHIDNNADVTVVYHHGEFTDNNGDTMLLSVDKESRIKEISFESPENGEVNYSIGITIIQNELLLHLVAEANEDGCISLNRDVLAKGNNKLRMFGYEHKGFVAIMNETKAYYNASMKLLDADVRKLLFTKERPIFTKTRDDMPTRYGTKASVSNCSIADGCVINGTVKNSILFRGVTVEKDAVVENSILMQQTAVKSGAQLDNVISDKNAVIGENMVLKGTPEKCAFVKKNQIL